MFDSKILGFAFLIVAFCCLFSMGQYSSAARPETSQNSQTDQNKFISYEGGFSIIRPQKKDDRSDPNYLFTKDIDDGGFTWKNGLRFIEIFCFSEIHDSTDTDKIIKGFQDTFIQGLNKNSAEILSKREFRLSGNPAFEVKFRVKSSEILFRSILVKDRVFTLKAAWPSGEEPGELISVIDSFQLVDNAEFKRKRLAEGWPKELPQSPTVKRPISDTAFDQLIGKVKSVTEYSQNDEHSLTRDISSETTYDISGNTLNKIYYDYRSNPMTIMVYGFVDGKRVSNQTSMHYGYDPPFAVGAPPGYVKPKDEGDPRYQLSYEFKYDDAGRVVEADSFLNTRKPGTHTTYTYSGNKIEVNSFYSTGTLSSKTVKYLDDKGNVVKEDLVSPTTTGYDESSRDYIYLEFDKNENWIKRVLTGKTAGGQDYRRVQLRTITYY